MSNREPVISVPVDVTNPGQFFACCGLLELAHQVDHSALGWFLNGSFHLAGCPGNLVEQFLDCPAVPIIEDQKVDAESDNEDSNDHSSNGEGKIVPILLGPPFNLRLDWWRSKGAEDAKLKSWSAGQKVTDLLNGKTTVKKSKKGERPSYSPGMRDHFKASYLKNPDDWLRAAELIESPKAFCYDSRLSRNNALDLGHVTSSDLAFSPAVEVLILVGLQRFRPKVIERWTRNLYCIWNAPLPVDIASVVALGLVPHLIDGCFEFPIKPRDSQGRYKLFGHAQPVRRPHV